MHLMIDKPKPNVFIWNPFIRNLISWSLSSRNFRILETFTIQFSMPKIFMKILLDQNKTIQY